LARSYGQQAKSGAQRILSLEGSFHGRTVAGMCLTAQEKMHSGFGDLLQHHVYLPLNDIDLLEKEFAEHGADTCAFFMELVQGEGGIHVADQEYVERVRELCNEHGVLLILDEIQTAMGRTGKLFCYENYGIEPDAMTLSKALGNGFPIGAIVVAEQFTKYLVRPQHGSTFSGNHIACTAAYEVLRILHTRDVFQNVAALSEYFFKRLRVFAGQYALIKEVRGLGLHIGMELHAKGPELVSLAREQGLLLNCTAGQTIRIMPPLNIDMDQAAAGLDVLDQCLGMLQK
ncbi:MAG: aminotransferase class III-fold pyridoxal phosphate-dependent enzyme, partial [Leptospiraceae bacterium]|nr:aminotransferase class III-fold pyridoxal phosphate-dependent enzyme [Leptospiraceae bacterium]